MHPIRSLVPATGLSALALGLLPMFTAQDPAGAGTVRPAPAHAHDHRGQQHGTHEHGAHEHGGFEALLRDADLVFYDST